MRSQEQSIALQGSTVCWSSHLYPQEFNLVPESCAIERARPPHTDRPQVKAVNRSLRFAKYRVMTCAGSVLLFGTNQP
jgi:hypothetical protein